MNTTTRNQSASTRARLGFTLIELLTVMAIIAMLAAIAGPPLGNALTTAQMTAAMGEARGIGVALRLEAEDNDGVFADGENYHGQEITTSNDAFRGLFPDFVNSEKSFDIKRSAWGPKADNRCTEVGEILEAGENHFAYVAGLNTGSPGDWPLIVDGTDGNGYYTDETGAKGGAWGGRKAIVVYVGGNAALVRLKTDGGGEGDGGRFIPRFEDSDENLLDVQSYMGENVRLLEPDEG